MTGPYGPVPATPVLALGAVGAVPPGLGVVEGDEIPYQPEALAKKKENQENWLTRDPEIKCYLPGVPRATYMPYPFQIVQSASAVVHRYEYAGAVRNIYMKDPGPAPVDSWMGQSVGRWEGDTLVVDVTGFNDQTWFDRAGNFHSDALHVVERYTRTEPGRHRVRSHDRGSESLHAAVEDEHAALPAAGEERAADGLQVRRVRRGVDVRPVAQEAAEPVDEDRHASIRSRDDSLLACDRLVRSGCARSRRSRQARVADRRHAKPPPRLADGHPDLQGTYDLATLTPLERPAGMKPRSDARGSREAREARGAKRASGAQADQRRSRGAAERRRRIGRGRRERRRLQHVLARSRARRSRSSTARSARRSSSIRRTDGCRR